MRIFKTKGFLPMPKRRLFLILFIGLWFSLTFNEGLAQSQTPHPPLLTSNSSLPTIDYTSTPDLSVYPKDEKGRPYIDG